MTLHAYLVSGFSRQLARIHDRQIGRFFLEDARYNIFCACRHMNFAGSVAAFATHGQKSEGWLLKTGAASGDYPGPPRVTVHAQIDHASRKAVKHSLSVA